MLGGHAPRGVRRFYNFRRFFWGCLPALVGRFVRLLAALVFALGRSSFGSGQAASAEKERRPKANGWKASDEYVAYGTMGTQLRILGFLLVLLLALGVTSCTSADLSPTALAQETKEIVDQVKSQEKGIYQIIDENLKRVKELKEMVQKAEDPANLYDQVLQELRRIAEDFEKLNEERVKRGLAQRLRSLHQLMGKAQEEVARLRARISELQAKVWDPDPEILEIKRKGYSQAIRYLQKQVEIWEKFLATQKAISGELRKIEGRVERFLAIIEVNAVVYREALNLLQLQKDIREAQSLLAEIPEIERLAQEMVSTWEILDSLVETLLSLG